MRLRLRDKLPVKAQAWLRRRSTKSLIGIAIVGAALLIIAGGGVYAALGGFGQTSTSGDINLQKGLVGWWKLDGNAKDSSPYALDGVLTGASASADRKGKTSGAENFTGSATSNMIVNTDNNFPSTAFTSSFWVNSTTAGSRGLVSYSVAGGNDLLVTTGNIDIYIHGTDVTTGIPLPTGGWHHITVTWQSSGGAVILYLDGAQVYSGTIASGMSLANGGCFVLTQDQDARCGGFSSTQALNGSMDDVRMYNRVLSAPEVSALYNQYDAQINAASGENGLVGWWKMDGNAKDNTPYGNNATAINATLTTDRKGAVNSAYSFNGTNSSLNVVDKDSLDIRTDSKSWSMWVNTTSSGSQYLYRKSDSCGVNGMLSYISGGYIAAQITTGGNCVSDTSVTVQSPLHTYADGNWHLATTVLNRTANTLTLYMDGQSVNSVSAAALVGVDLNAVNPVIVGTSYSNVSPLTGSLDDLRIYSRALSAQDVANLYSSYNSQINLNSSPTNNQTVNLNSGLVGYWPFNGNAKDATPYQNNGTVSGATLTTDRKGRANSAYGFDGSTSYIDIPNSPAFTIGTNGFTYAAWVKPTALNSLNMVTSHDLPYMAISGAKAYLSLNAGGVQHSVAGTSTLTTGTWYHMVGTYDSSGLMKIYLNGVLQGTAGPYTPITNYASYHQYVGQHPPGTYKFTGNIDDVRIYNRALNSAEVSALYGNYY